MNGMVLLKPCSGSVVLLLSAAFWSLFELALPKSFPFPFPFKDSSATERLRKRMFPWLIE